MNSKEVIEVIETICDKLGIAINSFSDFVPNLAKYKISTDLFMLIISTVIIVLSLITIKRVFGHAKRALENSGSFYCDYADFPSVWLSSIVGGGLILFFVFTFVLRAKSLVGWIASPQASAVNYILSYFQQ